MAEGFYTDEHLAVSNISSALDGIEEMAAKLRELSDAGSRMGDSYTNAVDSMCREKRFDLAMSMWRQFTIMGTAVSWLQLHARSARRNVNTLLDAIPDCPETADEE